jgi:CubicO group peptidase (beta-lactamase class C family)
MERPAYSNIAFSVMMLALQEQMGKNYTQLVRDVITVPLDMPNTMVSPGQDEKAVIPPVENSWGSDYRVNAP